MIRVELGPHHCHVSGHAGSGPWGRDLVCAAVSTLVLTLAENVRRLAAQGAAEDPRILLDRGTASISCLPAGSGQDPVVPVFETLALGFRLLARQYPEFIFLSLPVSETPSGSDTIGPG